MSPPVDAPGGNAPGRRLRVLIGRDRFSERHGWGELARHWPAAVAARVDVEAVEVGRLDDALRRGRPPVDVVVPIMSPVTAATIAAGSFGLVQQFGVGVEAIDVAAASEHGVWVATMPGVNTAPVAEHAVALLLALVHRLPEAPRGFEPGRWGEPAGGSLAGSRVVVLGLGAVGTAVALRLTALGAAVTGVHRRPPATAVTPAACDRLAPVEHLHAVLTDADAVVVAASHERGRAPVLDAAAIRLGAALAAHLDHRPPADLLNPLPGPMRAGTPPAR